MFLIQPAIDFPHHSMSALVPPGEKTTKYCIYPKTWLKASRLRLNPTKTQVMWLGSPQQLAKVNVTEVPVALARINVSETARNLGVIVDSQLTLSGQMAAVCRSGYYQLRQLRPLVRSMSSDAVKTLVRAFISCRLDYCNSMFYGITDGLMSRLQYVENAAARLVSGGSTLYDHITPVLQELHWLPVRRFGLKNGHSGLLVTVRYGSTLPSR